MEDKKLKLIIQAHLLDSVETLENTSADFIDLETNLHLGGTAPSLEIIGLSELETNKPIIINLKFKYDSYQISKEDRKRTEHLVEIISNLKNVKAIKWSALDNKGSIDIEALKWIISIKNDLKLFFGRAVDSARDYEKSIDDLVPFIDDIDYVLTSGGSDSSLDGIENLKYAVKKLPNKIIACSKITVDNVEEILENVDGLQGIHVSKGVKENFDISAKLSLSHVETIRKLLNEFED